MLYEVVFLLFVVGATVVCYCLIVIVCVLRDVMVLDVCVMLFEYTCL